MQRHPTLMSDEYHVHVMLFLTSVVKGKKSNTKNCNHTSEKAIKEFNSDVFCVGLSNPDEQNRSFETKENVKKVQKTEIDKDKSQTGSKIYLLLIRFFFCILDVTTLVKLFANRKQVSPHILMIDTIFYYVH